MVLSFSEQLTIRAIGEAEATDASTVIHASFMKLAAPGWEPNAQNAFLSESSPDEMARKLKAAALSFGAFTGEQIIGVLLMPTPNILGMLFVHPAWLRRGIASSLWEHARAEIERTFPTVKTIELNSTPYAIDFYRSAGFVPISAEFELGGCRATRMACWLPARALGAEKAMNDQIKIELAQAQDAAAIVAVHYAAVHQTARSFYSEEVINSWSRPISNDRVERIKQVVKNSDEWMIVARQNNLIVGFGSIVSKDNELRGLYVHPGFGRCGFGARILTVLEHEARSLGLPYLQMDASINAELFYRKHGFEIIEYATH